MSRAVVPLESGGVAVGLQELAEGTKLDWEWEFNAQTGTSYTLVLTDASKWVTCTNAGAIALTVPANASVAFPTGTRVMVQQGGAGTVTVAGAGGVTVNAPNSDLSLPGQYAVAVLVKTATDEWSLLPVAGSSEFVVVADTTDASCYVGLFEDATGSLRPKTDGGLTYDASTGILTATGFSGPLNGTVGATTAAAGSFTTLRASSNLGVGNSEAGDTVNTVTKHIEIFDESGVSLGYIAVFDSIT